LSTRHADDQYAADAGARDVALTLERLPFAGPVRVQHWRIDARHSNSHTAWQALGRPQDPSEGQLRAIKERQGLEMLEPGREVAVAGGQVTLTVALPLPSVSLLEIRPA
jgi:xylan 1,4-beta-xylosidase